MGDQILDKRNGFLTVGGSDQVGKRLVVFPAVVVFRGIDGFAEDGGGVEQGDGFRLSGETVLQAFVDFQAIVIPGAGVIEREGKFVVGDVVDVADVIAADVPEFDVVVAGNTGHL